MDYLSECQKLLLFLRKQVIHEYKIQKYENYIF